MTKTSKITYFFLSILFFIIFDLYFSNLIINSLRYTLPSNNILNLVYVLNSGAAFNILENSRIFLIIFAILAILLILFYAVKHADKFSTISGFWTAMLVAGVACNLYERISLGYVRDFFQLGFVSFPVFNISDIYINIGVLALIIIIIKNKYLKR